MTQARWGILSPTSLFGWAAINTASAVGKTHRASCNKAAGKAESHPEIEIIILWQVLHLCVYIKSSSVRQTILRPVVTVRYTPQSYLPSVTPCQNMGWCLEG